MDLKSLNIDQLKAKIYDSLVVVENHQQFIKMLNQELASRVNPPVGSGKPEVQEIVNEIIKEDETK
jgi:hypothetical protein